MAATRLPDALVIGAGVVGLSIAWELARLGARVHVLDPRSAGDGATQASAGMLAPHIEAHDQPDLWRLGVRSLDLYDGFVARLRDESSVAIDYRRTGSLQVAVDEAACRDLMAIGDRLRTAGVRADWLDRALVCELEPQMDEQVGGGLFISSHGYVSAPDLVAALSSVLTGRGVRISAERVLRVTGAAPELRVETDSGVHRAPSVVVAAGAWTSRVAVPGDYRVPVRPVRGQLVLLDWPSPPLAQTVWGPDCYLVPWTSGTMLVGATLEDAGFDERATAAGVRDLLEAACDLLPTAWQAGFAGVKVGLRPGTPDGLPVIGRAPATPGLFYATGHYRNGILLAPVTAVLVADLLLAGRADSDLACLNPSRFDRHGPSARNDGADRT